MGLSFIRTVALALALCLPCCNANAAAETNLMPISLQLIWKHQFQFAGYYAAQERGYYREAGLDVTFREANPDEDTVEAVLKGQSEFGVGTSDLLLYRARGRPVVVLGVIFQHSPLAIMSLESSGIHNIHQIAGKRVMIEYHAAELFAYLKREGVPITQSRIQFFPHSFGVEELLSGKVDAMSVYITDEPYAISKAGLNYSIFSPRSAGIDFYGDNLFTSESYLQAHPQVVASFREASLRGWEYAMSHPDEMADLIIARFGNRKGKDQLLFEYEQMLPLLRPELVALGYMYPGRWQHIADVYAELGMMQADFQIKDFLYNPDTLHIPIWVYWAAGGVVGFSLLACGVAIYILRINRRLSREIAKRNKMRDGIESVNRSLRIQIEQIQSLQDELREQALHDPLTNLYNRRYFHELLERELAQSEREGKPLSLVMIDIDYFKKINDTYGHQAGDRVLVALAEILTSSTRSGDAAFRFGGEEFVLILPGMDAEIGLGRAESLRKIFAEKAIHTEDGDAKTTLSAGIATYPTHAVDAKRLLRKADKALYAAKEAGRNRTQIAE